MQEQVILRLLARAWFHPEVCKQVVKSCRVFSFPSLKVLGPLFNCYPFVNQKGNIYSSGRYEVRIVIFCSFLILKSLSTCFSARLFSHPSILSLSLYPFVSPWAHVLYMVFMTGVILSYVMSWWSICVSFLVLVLAGNPPGLDGLCCGRKCQFTSLASRIRAHSFSCYRQTKPRCSEMTSLSVL